MRNKFLLISMAIFFAFIFPFGTCLAKKPVERVEFSKVEKSPRRLAQLSSVLRKTDKKDMERALRQFVACCRPNRFVGNDSHKMAQDYLVQAIKTADPEQTGTVRLDEFDPDINYAINLYQSDFDVQIKEKYKPQDSEYKKWDTFTKNMIGTLQSLKKVKGTNIVWEKKGTTSPQEVLIVGAHYDNIVFNKKDLSILPQGFSLGANDNGTGVVLLLKLIEYLSQLEIKKTVRVVFFDFEEVGFLGSRSYVESLKKEVSQNLDLKILGYVNLEMLGQDSQGLDKEKKYGNMKLYIRKSTDSGHAEDRELATHFQKVAKQLPTGNVQFEIEANGFNSSDHIAFWKAGFRAITFSQNWETDFNEGAYHTESDLVEMVNLRTLTYAFHFIGGGIMAILLNLHTPY